MMRCLPVAEATPKALEDSGTSSSQNSTWGNQSESISMALRGAKCRSRDTPAVPAPLSLRGHLGAHTDVFIRVYYLDANSVV
jgi:hypothetical protein